MCMFLVFFLMFSFWNILLSLFLIHYFYLSPLFVLNVFHHPLFTVSLSILNVLSCKRNHVILTAVTFIVTELVIKLFIFPLSTSTFNSSSLLLISWVSFANSSIIGNHIACFLNFEYKFYDTYSIFFFYHKTTCATFRVARFLLISMFLIQNWLCGNLSFPKKQINTLICVDLNIWTGNWEDSFLLLWVISFAILFARQSWTTSCHQANGTDLYDNLQISSLWRYQLQRG